MKTGIKNYLKHLLITIFVLVPALIAFGLSQGASLHYDDDRKAYDWNNEGPYVFTIAIIQSM